jgi:hypothetical protein
MGMSDVVGTTGIYEAATGTDTLSGRHLTQDNREQRGIFGTLQLVTTTIGVKAGVDAYRSRAVEVPSTPNTKTIDQYAGERNAWENSWETGKSGWPFESPTPANPKPNAPNGIKGVGPLRGSTVLERVLCCLPTRKRLFSDELKSSTLNFCRNVLDKNGLQQNKNTLMGQQ